MDTKTDKPAMWFWVISIVALLWNLLGVLAYLQQTYMEEETFSTLSETERNLLESQPEWVTAAFAIAVWGGLLGSIALMLRKSWARPVFIISLLGIIVQQSYFFLMTDSVEIFGPQAIVMPLLVLLVGIGLVFFAGMAQKKGWIR